MSHETRKRQGLVKLSFCGEGRGGEGGSSPALALYVADDDGLAGMARERFVRRENLPLMKRGARCPSGSLLGCFLKLARGAPRACRTVAIACLNPFPGDDRTGAMEAGIGCECVRPGQSAIFLLKRGGRARRLGHRHLCFPPSVGDSCGNNVGTGRQRRRAPLILGALLARCHGKWAPFASAATGSRSATGCPDAST